MSYGTDSACVRVRVRPYRMRGYYAELRPGAFMFAECPGYVDYSLVIITLNSFLKAT